MGALRGLVPIPYVALQDMAIREASPLGHHSTLPAGGRVPWMCQESGPPEPPNPRLLDRVRHAIETRHYSRRTETAYIHWIKGAQPIRLVQHLYATPRLHALRQASTAYDV